MITLGIIGFGNVALEVHLPILLARSDIKITWIFDKLTASENICKKKNIPFYNSLDSALKFKCPEIVLITTPYNQRKDIFNKISFEDWSHSQGSDDRSQPTPNINEDIPISSVVVDVKLV
mgnify:CR=1 FL=1